MRADPIGYYVRHADHLVYVNEMRMDRDVERLRADTAEAELAKLRYKAELYDEVWADATGRGYANVTMALCALTAAEQRIAELSADNQQLRKLLEQTLAALNPTKTLSKSISAALSTASPATIKQQGEGE